MKIIITEEQFYNLIPQSIRRRMSIKDFEILDDIIHTNKKYDLNNPFDKYLDINLRDSLNEFITEYKVGKLDPNLDDNDWEREESLMYKIFWQLIPFVKKKYHNELYEYYMENHRRRGSMNESKDEKLFKELPISIRRRLEPDDLDYIDRELMHFILTTPPTNDFEYFSSSVIGDVLHDFILGCKSDEIEIEEDPDYGEVYNEESRNKVMDKYWVLKPFLEKKYKDRLYQAWERKKTISL
jgi:hypothetical protein